MQDKLVFHYLDTAGDPAIFAIDWNEVLAVDLQSTEKGRIVKFILRNCAKEVIFNVGFNSENDEVWERLKELC